ncbi:2-succinyl-6-hydroxy-2,4-cyclohexadiene-1-carboxylate synthase [Aliagarivorans marinus]|uniref:2-succinyl-6-hydroxy-2, 4-cyclohexadiene-1-carboxylate synthase n=1 Tax=Aliagarivorans marinus TaxID=561965 RepID=UPI0004164E7C|nr:2-succinyl-6-hydroxy-2,4-cyclohexadiene-1-carboxylate synthase [Aliagarivorans marinus]
MSNLHFKVQGQRGRPCVVLLHGFLGSGNDWQHTLAALSERYYCVAIDLPGHGMSGELQLKPTKGFKHFHQLLVDCLQRLHITQYSLLGYSLGGRLAMYHALQKPKGLQCLILESCHSGLDDHRQQQARLSHDAKWAERWQHEPREQVLQAWYSQEVFHSLSEAQRDSLVTKRLSQNPQGLAAMLDATSLGRQDDFLSGLATLKIPMSLITGSDDRKFCRLAQQMCQAVPQLAWHMIQGAGHNVHIDQPDAFNQQLLDCLN